MKLIITTTNLQNYSDANLSLNPNGIVDLFCIFIQYEQNHESKATQDM